jgi:nucleoside-triphosphatase THEP1
MIYIVIGKINSGKTQMMISLYNKEKKGDGFVSVKIFDEGEHIGYMITRLSTDEKMPLAMKTHTLPPKWDGTYRCGPYSFSKKALTFAEKIVEDSMFKGFAPIYLDEVGPLELGNRGFYRILKKVLQTGVPAYITVRDSCVKEVVKKFKIDQYEIISV